jgi:hypothetical protein
MENRRFRNLTVSYCDDASFPDETGGPPGAIVNKARSGFGFHGMALPIMR